MVSDWLVPLLLLLLALVLIALWFRLRARRRAEPAAGSALTSGAAPGDPAPENPAPDPTAAPEEVQGFQGFPPEILAVREELARIRAEEDALASTVAPARSEPEKDAPADTPEKGASVEGEPDAPKPMAAEKTEPAAADEAEAMPAHEVEAVPVDDAPTAETSAEATSPEKATESAQSHDHDAAPHTDEVDDDAPDAAPHVDDTPHDDTPHDGTPHDGTPQADDDDPEEDFTGGELPDDDDPDDFDHADTGHDTSGHDTSATPSAPPPNTAPVGDTYDDDGRLVLPVGMGDIIVPTEVPRRIVLSVTRQWPIPVIQGFRPEEERLDLLYDGPEPNDVVMLPTIYDTWQVSLGGRPVVQVGCAAGPDALASALRVNPS